MAHGLFLFLGISEDELRFPKAEGTVRFESGHAAEYSVAIEVRKLPLDGFLDIGAAGMNDLAYMLQDRSGERSRLIDVGIDAWIFLCHNLMMEIATGRRQPLSDE